MPRAIARVILIVAGWIAITATSQATVIFKVDDGQLVGAQNVDVGGTSYDVAFVDGSCIALFPGCDDISDFDYDDSAFAQAAARVLLEQVFVNVGSDTKTQYDSVPSLVFGCEESVGDAGCATLIPFATDGKDVGAWIATNTPGQAENSVGTGGMGSAELPEESAPFNFAQFSLASTAVPSPATVALASHGGPSSGNSSAGKHGGPSFGNSSAGKHGGPSSGNSSTGKHGGPGSGDSGPASITVPDQATLVLASTAVSGPATLALVLGPLLLLMVTRTGKKA